MNPLVAILFDRCFLELLLPTLFLDDMDKVISLRAIERPIDR